MTKKTRYSLLAFGFVIFLILAPIIVLYVRGITYDFATKSFVSTGILAVRSTPKDADILLNGKLTRQGSGDLKFLIPGEYQITLKKSGYEDWNKRLKVETGHVTWANPVNSFIYLIAKSPEPKILDTKVLDFFSNDRKLVYLTSGYAAVNGQNYSLPKAVNKILSYDSAGKNFIFSGTTTSGQESILYFNSDNGTFSDLSGLLPTPSRYQFSENGDLFALNNNTLYKIDYGAVNKSIVLQQVQTFYFRGNDLYYITQKGSLMISQDPFKQSELLSGNLPKFNQGELFVTFGKQIFLIADKNLYQNTGNFEKIADNIDNYDFNEQDSILNFFHSGEFDYFDSGSNLNFITRSGENLSNLRLKNNIGYAFYIKNNQINAIELDNRGSQNQYSLYHGEKLQKFYINSSAENITLLDNGDLKTILIR